MRLINGDKLYEVIQDFPAMYEEAREMKEDVLLEISETPTVDAVVVTRCKDCANSYEDAFGRVCTYGICVDCTVPDDFYCASSKPKEGAE